VIAVNPTTFSKMATRKTATATTNRATYPMLPWAEMLTKKIKNLVVFLNLAKPKTNPLGFQRKCQTILQQQQ